MAESYAAVHLADSARGYGYGYGYGMHRLLPVLAADPDAWRTEARNLFGAEGSLGNGAAMRVAPLGAWFHQDVEEAAEQAVLSAEVTHAHPEGIAGAVAVAVAAALAGGGMTWRHISHGNCRLRWPGRPAGLIRDGLIRDGVLKALNSPRTRPPGARRTSATSTPPCAITGGVIAARTGVGALPQAWRERREPLPDWV